MVNDIKNAWSSKERKTEEDIVGVAILKTAKIVKTVRLIDSVPYGIKESRDEGGIAMEKAVKIVKIRTLYTIERERDRRHSTSSSSCKNSEDHKNSNSGLTQ